MNNYSVNICSPLLNWQHKPDWMYCIKELNIVHLPWLYITEGLSGNMRKKGWPMSAVILSGYIKHAGSTRHWVTWQYVLCRHGSCNFKTGVQMVNLLQRLTVCKGQHFGEAQPYAETQPFAELQPFTEETQPFA